ncbi:hypothetical protein BLOT_002220, partial [Blomia tropicalis]
MFIHLLTLMILICVIHGNPFERSNINDRDERRQTSTERFSGNVWRRMAIKHIEQHYRKQQTNGKMLAKNVILFIGDGMGMSTITATRILKGQQRIATKWVHDPEMMSRQMSNAEEEQLSFETFDHVALTKTYNMNSQVGDSGACATALMCGTKANYETIGLDGNIGKLDDCKSSFIDGARVSSIAEWAQQHGKSTGFVTTTRVTHATPAAFYAHSANRYWENDDKTPTDDGCKDIARQLVEDDPGKNLNVILGGGMRNFLDQRSNPIGMRKDGRNLIDQWLNDKRERGLSSKFIQDGQQLNEMNTNEIDYLLGLFSPNHMTHEADRHETDEPSLSEMTVKAIEILKHNPNGYLLMVESGRIDHAHHNNNAYRALTDTIALDETVDRVLQLVNVSNTLVLVTADHSHVFTFGGSVPKRGNSILGLDRSLSDLDHLPYTTLLYGNGPGNRAIRDNLTNTNTESKQYKQQSAIPRRWSTHGGEDVPLYAIGPGSNMFTGVVDQTFVPYGIAYATCIGPMSSLCLNHSKQSHLKNECINYHDKNVIDDDVDRGNNPY